jgi:two-component system cell cycle response regulator
MLISTDREQQPNNKVNFVMHFLVVDDQEPNRIYYNDMLARRGHTFENASSGNEAKRVLASKSKISIVITDILMPDGDGADLIRHIQQVHPHIVTIGVSGGGHLYYPNPAINYAKDHANGFLWKPFEEEEFDELMANLSQSILKNT